MTNCGAFDKPSAMQRCAGCKDAPESLPSDSVGTVYCDQDCQKRHRDSHKAHYRTLQQCKQLLRGTKMLKAALLRYREAVYDTELTNIELEGGTLWLNQIPRATHKRVPFPNHVTTNAEHKEAALVVIKCTRTMARLGRLTRKLLASETVPFRTHSRAGKLMSNSGSFQF